MTPSVVRQKIRQRVPILCSKACYEDPELVELMASADFDAIWICQEHKRSDPATIRSLIQACRLGGADALIRVKPANYTDVLHLLELGARGIMLPRVRHVDEVREIVSAMKFPPLGRRGLDAIHAEADFGRRSMGEYLATANEENFLAVQIEEPDVVPHIDAIAATPGVDVLFVGPGDLTLGLNRFGQTDDPEVRGILQQVADACRRHGRMAGIPCAPEQVREYYDLGFRFFNIASDYRCVINGLRKARADALNGIGTSGQKDP
jgi:2-keto-3-deoxy-L-rhamnonate aldolase RhmA